MLTLYCTHPKVFKAISLCAAKNDIREVLNGIYIEPEKGLATASNGHRLFSARVFEPVSGAEPFIAKIEVPNVTDSLVLTLEGSRVEICTPKKIVVGSTIDGTYYDYQKVLGDGHPPPNESALKNISFNPMYLADVQKTLKALGVIITMTDTDGFGPMQIEFKVDGLPDGYRFILMPMRW